MRVHPGYFRASSSKDISELISIVADSVPVLLSYVDSLLRYRPVNQPYADRFDMKTESIEGSRVVDIIGTKAFETVRHHLEKALAGECIVYDSPIEYLDRQPRFVLVTLVPHIDSSGAVKCFVGIVDDVQELRTVECELAEANDRLDARVSKRTQEIMLELETQRSAAVRFRNLIESSGDCMFVHREGVLLYVNPATLTCLGYGDELLGQHVSMILPADLREAVRHLHAGLAERGRTPVQEGRLLRADGQDLPVEFLAIQIIFDGQSAVLTIARDTSARNELTARMMEMDRMITGGTLAAGMGHEINNPLTYAIGNLKYVQEELDKIKKLEAFDPSIVPRMNELISEVEEARTGAERAAEVVLDLRSLSRTSAREHVPLDTASLVRSALRMANNEIRHRATIVNDLDEAGPLQSLQGDHSRLSQVFLTLFINAAQAIELGRANDNQVSVRANVRPDRVDILISDTGQGIPLENLERIFEPFFTTKSADSGTGLGLSICREIVREHAGEFHASREVGRGTTFTVSLPLATESLHYAPLRAIDAVPSSPGHRRSAVVTGKRAGAPRKYSCRGPSGPRRQDLGTSSLEPTRGQNLSRRAGRAGALERGGVL